MFLLIGDLHLTDRPRDAYRFDIFPWIRKQQLKHKPVATILMGDITDQKDKHPASLVNRVIDELLKLKPPVYIIKGNHDYIAEGEPFFKFINRLEGVEFVVKPMFVIPNIVAIPHFRTQALFNEALSKFGNDKFKAYIEYIFLHQTFDGAIAESGSRLSGFSTSPIEAMWPKAKLYAGDVHRPQRAGCVTYVGAPYTIRFGDAFYPRCLLLERGKPDTVLHFNCLQKWKLLVRSADEIRNDDRLFEGDQVKITIELAREEAVEAKTYKAQIMKACEAKGLEIFGIDIKVNSATAKKQEAEGRTAQQPAEVFKDFCKQEKLPSQTKESGLELLNA